MTLKQLQEICMRIDVGEKITSEECYALGTANGDIDNSKARHCMLKFACLKHSANQCRLEGKIQRALENEAYAEEYYRQLPDRWQW